MHIITTLAIIINILSIVILTVGLFYNFEQPKIKAIYGYTIAGCFIPYIILCGLIGVYEFIINHNLYSFILFFGITSPFIIGKLVKYETLKRYTIIQIICFILSLAALIFKF